jgi:putative transposase
VRCAFGDICAGRGAEDGGCKTRPTLLSGNSDVLVGRCLIGFWLEKQHAGCMPNYRRVRVPGGTFFFTVNLLERRRALLVDHIDALRSAFEDARKARPFTTIAIVVLPDHLHCVWRLPENDCDNATRWRQIKTAFVKAMPCGERRSSRRELKGERGIWQRRYWEHLIRDERDFRSHIDYIHFNPVKHGHVSRVIDWPYSSFHRWVRNGQLPADWAG